MKTIVNKLTLVFFLLLVAGFAFGQTDRQQQATFELDLAALTEAFKKAPDFTEKALHRNGPAINLTMPDGRRKQFIMFQTHPMHPELAAKFPEILTYHGKCYDDGVSGVSVTISPAGLRAMVIDEHFERIYIEPEGGAVAGRYVSFYEPEDLLIDYTCTMGHESPEVILPKTEQGAPPPPPSAKSMVNNANALGDKLRTHRLAVSCTGEYAIQQGGTVSLVMDKITENVNAMNLVYIREVSVQFQLVPNNEDVIYLDPNTDPYVNDGHHTPDLDNVHNTLTAIIGSANFDVGHLMQDPSATCPNCGGWAGVGVPCDDNGKGKGMSVQSIAVLIHEMGHQFNCHHTTDHLPTRRDHIKIGNTIMGNGGIPGPSNYFHIVSADSIGRYVEQAGYCVPGVNTNNTIPMVDAGTGGMTIPKSTPFQLSGSATDPDPNTTLLYNWQQYDIGDTYNVINGRIHPVGNVPIFRNYFPAADGNVRTIPRLPDLVNNVVSANVSGDTMDYEGLPTYSRSLTFRLVARDFEPTGGAFDYDELTFSVDGNSGPFVVTSPNTGNPTWTAGNNVTVTWDVANTNNAPVNCATVNILLSQDGGYSYPITLATATANDGSHTFTLPPGIPQSTFARVKVESATHDNVRFFDISNENFTINSDCKAASALISPAGDVTAPAGSPSLDLNPAPVFGLSNSTTTFNVAASGPQTQFALWNTPQTACQIGCCSNYYTTREFQVDRPGTYTFGFSFDGGGTPGFMSIHDVPYDPNDVCAGFVTSNWRATAGVELIDPFEAALVPGTTYTMVFHPWIGNSTASGTASVSSSSGGNAVYLNQGPPPPSPPGDYGYTYAAVNTANGQIAAINAGADFTGLAAGTYHVYGLSYKAANPPPAVVNPDDFLNLTIAQAINTNQCIYFSSNFIKVVVTGTGTPSISIAATDANKAEGNAGTTAFTFTVTRTGDVTNQTTADWAVTGSGANPANGADFSGGNFPNGTVTFPAGSMATQTVTVNVNGDTDIEPDEGFTVTLSNPANATITTATANGTIQNDDAAASYCAAGATNTGFEKISNVEFNTINNASTSTAGYEDFTAISTTVQQGSTHAFTGTISNPYIEDEIIVWIDFNQDLDFEDPGEEVFNSPTGVGPHTGNITIPGGAMTGNTRMRVRLHDTANNPNATPCGNSEYGQVEDYTINITAAVPVPGIAIAATDANKAEGNAGTTAFTFTVTRTGDVTNQTTADWAVTGAGADPANGADFSGGNFPNGTVTFPAGSMAAQTVTVNVNGDTDIEPDEGFTVTLSNPTNATITTAAANGTIQNDDAAAGYCAAGADITSGQKISNVEFNTINNPSTSTAGYEDFTAVTTTVQQGSTHAFTGTITNSDGLDQIIVWMDFNQDLDFDDPGEQVFISPTGPGPHTSNIAIPANATTGNTRMRVRLHNTLFGSNTTPCGNSLLGQVEDYTINITVAVPVPTIAIAATDANKAEGNAGMTAFTFTVTRTGDVTNQTTADWAVTGSGANPANGADFSGGNFPNGTVTFPAGSMATQTITVNVNGDTDVEPDEGFTVTLSNPVNATITTATADGTIQNDDAAAGYCAAGGGNPSGEKISNVQFNTINNPSAATTDYEDFTAVTTTVQQGSTHAFTGTISNPFNFDEIIVWIDFNQDLDFDDPGEEVFNSPTGNGPHTGNITIPANAMTGNTRMRVRLHDTANGPNATPCGNSTWGQVEDYTINITAGGGPCPNTLAVPGTIASGTYQAAMDLTSDGVVPNANVVVFKAGTSILLEPEFEVEPGATLEVTIEGCVPFAPQAGGQ